MATGDDPAEFFKQARCRIENKLNTTRECFREITHEVYHVSLTRRFFNEKSVGQYEEDFKRLFDSFESIKRETVVFAEKQWNMVAIGKSKTGKTSFINSLLDKEDFLPTSKTSTIFNCVVQVSACEDSNLQSGKAKVSINTNEFTEVEENDVNIFICRNEDNNFLRVALPKQELDLPSPWMTLWDTPCLDRVENHAKGESRRSRVEQVLQEPRVLAVVLFDVELATMDPVIENIKFVREKGIPPSRILVAVTRWDSVPDEEKMEEREETMKQLHECCKREIKAGLDECIGGLFFIDATNAKGTDFIGIRQKIMTVTQADTQSVVDNLKNRLGQLENEIDIKYSEMHDMLKCLESVYAPRRELEAKIRTLLKEGLKDWKNFIMETMEGIHVNLVDAFVRGGAPSLGQQTRENVTPGNRVKQHELITDVQVIWSGHVSKDIRELSSRHSKILAEHVTQEKWLSTMAPQTVQSLIRKYRLELEKQKLHLSQPGNPDPVSYRYDDKEGLWALGGTGAVVLLSLSAGGKILNLDISRRVWIIGGIVLGFVGLGAFLMSDRVAKLCDEKRLSNKKKALKDLLDSKLKSLLESISTTGAESYMSGLLSSLEENTEKAQKVNELLKRLDESYPR